MPSCCVKSCKNSFRKGYRVFRIPRDQERKKKWLDFIRREDLSDASVVCEAHFEETQFEQNRADGRKLLSKNAVPTLLSPLDNESNVSNSVINENNIDNDVELYILPHELDECNDDDDDDDINISDKHDIDIDAYKKRIKALLQEKRRLQSKLQKKEENFEKVFNEDQLKYIELGTHKGFSWSDDTMDKGIKLYLSCGSKGYGELLAQNLPYPSIRTIQDRLHRWKFRQEIEKIFL